MIRIVIAALLVAALSAATSAAQDTTRRTSAAASASASAPVNLNTATAAQLETLPGIGKATAERILEYRQKNGSFKKYRACVGTVVAWRCGVVAFGSAPSNRPRNG